MVQQIHVKSIDLVARLEDAIGTFATKATDSMDEFASGARRIANAIEDHLVECERQLEYCEDAYGNADEDDDIDSLGFQLVIAQEKLEKARYWSGRIAEGLSDVIAATNQGKRIADEKCTSAEAFLEKKRHELIVYAQEQLSVDMPLNDLMGSPVWDTSQQIDRRLDAFSNASGKERTEFCKEDGRFADDLWKSRIRERETEMGRIEGSNYGLQFCLRHPDGKNVYYDYVDLDNDLIVEYNAKNQVKKKTTQRRRHIEAYEARYGRTPEYVYETYDALSDRAVGSE